MPDAKPRPDASAVSAPQAALDLWAVVARLLRQFREAGADQTITPSQASALARLGKGGVSTVSALAGAERVRPQSMAAIVEALESAGLVTRTQDPSDGRRQIIELTDAGRTRVAGQRDAAASWLEHALEALDQDELRTITTATGLLERMLP
jgi:DNA-binding MarR family transcriptional regulator